mmetsp:Transcript_9554/g.19001  ORF Transcript_9554/g.19001 Transcript_9554/m.19001 type:complete len:479 (+) Transcript_9554:414-1850(+)
MIILRSIWSRHPHQLIMMSITSTSLASNSPKKLLGTQKINDAVQQHCDRLHKVHSKELQDLPCQCFRANWRSSVQYPWQLSPPSRLDQSQTDGSLSGVSIMVSPVTLFVDVTFDFLLFPYNKSGAKKDIRCLVCKLERSQKIYDNNSPGGKKIKDIATFGIAVATRIGAILATSTGSEHGNEQFRFHYLQGNPLSAADVHEHCRYVDVDPNFTDASQVADLIAKALLREERCKPTAESGISEQETDNCAFGKVRAVQEDCVQDAAFDIIPEKDEKKKIWRWGVKLYHKSLKMDGILTFHHQIGDDEESFDSLSPKATLCFGEPIGRQTLDIIMLNTAGDGDVGGNCVPITLNETHRLWSMINQSLLESLQDAESSSSAESFLRSITITTIPRQMDNLNHEMQSAQCEDSAPEKKATKTRQWPQSSKSSENNPSMLKRSSSKSSSSSRSQQEIGVFARGKKTSILGSKRKKKKLTLGDI